MSVQIYAANEKSRRSARSCRTIPSLAVTAATLLSGSQALAQCNAVGNWSDNYGGVRVVPAALVGTTKLPYCSMPHTLTVTVTGPTAFTTNNVYAGSDCTAFVESLTLDATCSKATGTFTNTQVSGTGPMIWTRNNLLTLTRTDLTRATATAQPSGGVFAYTTTVEAGANPPTVAIASGANPSTNPNPIEFKTVASGGGPKAGGRVKLTAKYTVNGQDLVNDANRAVAFGMSCYMLALESDYGTPPAACSSTRISGVTYSGSVTDPNGLTGTYCASFIANVRLQGSGQLNSGEYVSYNVSNNTIAKRTEITGSDGTAVAAGQTVARDTAIIPARGVLVDFDGVGNGLLANDKGGHIIGYRLDLFNGAGKAACANYANPVRIAACQTAQGQTCPTRSFQ